ncbi:MAG: GPW/gp25 family protein [Methanothrix sp.]
MAREFLGRGWKFPVSVDSRGGIAMSQHEEDIREAIWIILSTSRGERAMNSDFGCGVHDMVFSSISTSTLGMIRESVREALILWEPRIEILDVKAKVDGFEEGRVQVTVDYLVRATNNEFNLVYPFYLKE